MMRCARDALQNSRSGFPGAASVQAQLSSVWESYRTTVTVGDYVLDKYAGGFYKLPL